MNVKDEQADGFCYGIASHYLPSPMNNNARIFVRSYDFHLRKAVDGWRIDKLKFNLKYVDGSKALTG